MAPESPSPFRTVHHICVVVADLEAAVSYYQAIGVGPWSGFPPLSLFTTVSLPREDFETLQYKFCDLDNLQIQLCQPGEGDTPQRRFLDRNGPGVFHIGFGVPDVEAAERDGLARGLIVLMRGRRDDGAGFTYFDTEDGAGVTLQVRAVPAPR